MPQVPVKVYKNGKHLYWDKEAEGLSVSFYPGNHEIEIAYRQGTSGWQLLLTPSQKDAIVIS